MYVKIQLSIKLQLSARGFPLMSKKHETKKTVSDDYLKTLEKVKKQYQRYVELGELNKLPIQREEETVRYQPPSLEHPLTTNTVYINSKVE